MTNDKITQPVDIEETELDNANGGGLLLPAVQKVREAARRSTTAGDLTGDGLGDVISSPPPPPIR